MSVMNICFDDGAGYEQMMGKWSTLASTVFLDWLQVPTGAQQRLQRIENGQVEVPESTL